MKELNDIWRMAADRNKYKFFARVLGWLLLLSLGTNVLLVRSLSGGWFQSFASPHFSHSQWWR